VKVFEIQGAAGDSTIMIGENLRNLKKYIPVDKTVVITDANVRYYYQDDLRFHNIIEIGIGEASKNLLTVQSVYAKLMEFAADRLFFVVGIGGGIVCDIAGFVASTYLRGLRFGFVASTLLAQVDASVGGKNGVNFSGYKNLVGVFSQPEFVICDLELLKTLPPKEVRCGLAEIVKHAAIGDADLFLYLEKNYQKALGLDTEIIQKLVYDSIRLKSTEIIQKLVYDSIRLKSSIVNQDEKERGQRKKLNFGHTFGHAVEKTTGAPHGEAISVGMVLAATLSVKRGLLAPQEAERIEKLLQKLKLPTGLQSAGGQLIDALKKDKKRKGDRIDFVLLHGLGNAVVEEISLKELEAVTNKLCQKFSGGA
jgi:3-dehydroquinate synthase